MNPIVMYTDGSCIKKNVRDSLGFGGWGFVILNGESELKMSGGVVETTNNRMELRAVIEGLRNISSHVTIYSDSMYVIECAKGNWKRNKNTDMWREYDDISKNNVISWNWVRGHTGDKYNEMVDKLAKQYARSLVV
jgi:ribonuclease HI